ncbi:MAG TPA: CYTH domain-containing protein [Azospirillum sp.]
MPLEIERRFLVSRDVQELCREGQRIVQGYLPSAAGRTVRVRLAGAKGYLTMKGKRTGCVRSEREWEIPHDLAADVLSSRCRSTLIVKTRYQVEHAGNGWVIDVFDGANSGLIIAEIELDCPEQNVPLPDWVGREVTGDRRYGNSALAVHPVANWERRAA